MILSIDTQLTGGALPRDLGGEHALFQGQRLLVSVSQEAAAEALSVPGIRAADQQEVVAWCDWANARSKPRPMKKTSFAARRGGPLAAHWRCGNDD